MARLADYFVVVGYDHEKERKLFMLNCNILGRQVCGWRLLELSAPHWFESSNCPIHPPSRFHVSHSVPPPGEKMYLGLIDKTSVRGSDFQMVWCSMWWLHGSYLVWFLKMPVCDMVDIWIWSFLVMGCGVVMIMIIGSVFLSVWLSVLWTFKILIHFDLLLHTEAVCNS